MLKGHGGEIYAIARRSGISPDRLADFSSNVSPLPFPDGLERLLVQHMWQLKHLPEVDSLGMRLVLAECYNMRPEQFLVSGGTTEWIYSLPVIFRPSRVVVSLPTYADYIDAADIASIPVKEVYAWHAGMQTGQEHILDCIMEKLCAGSMVFLCNPNNPTGNFIAPRKIAMAARSAKNSLWIIDESYAPFIADDSESSMLCPSLPANCLVLRSFSKIFGIPGLRLGYIAGNMENIARIMRHARPWQVNRLAQVAGEWLAGDIRYQRQVRKFCAVEKQLFLDAIKGNDMLEYIPGDTHFMLFRVYGKYSAAYITAQMRQKGILIRDCSNFRGIEGEYIRISLRGSAANRMLAEEIQAIIYSG